jgi:hypothetical protein
VLVIDLGINHDRTGIDARVDIARALTAVG